MFQPFELSGSNCVLGRMPPKLRSEMVPQKSPPDAAQVLRRSSCRRSQSGTKLLLASVHDRDTWFADADVGLTGAPMVALLAPPDAWT